MKDAVESRNGVAISKDFDGLVYLVQTGAHFPTSKFLSRIKLQTQWCVEATRYSYYTWHTEILKMFLAESLIDFKTERQNFYENFTNSTQM